MSIHFPSKKPGTEFKQPIEPSNPQEGMTWTDTSQEDISTYGGIPKKYFEGEWRTLEYYHSYGYICGGYDGTNNLSIIDRITFPFDSGTANNVGNLSGSRRNLSANNSSTHGYICGGLDGTNLSTIDRITFPFDSGTANNVGNLSAGRYDIKSNNSSIHGYICGGRYGGGTNNSLIDRITFPFDSGTANSVGSLVRDSEKQSGGYNSSTHGFINIGGTGGSTGEMVNEIDRITFPFDSGTASDVGSLSVNIRYTSANNSSIHGYTCGGEDTGNNNLSTIDRITFPFDSGTANIVGNLSGGKRLVSANNSSTHGYICGGWDGTNNLSTIDRITFPFDSGTANNVGNLSWNRRYLSATDNVDFVAQFLYQY